MALSQLNWGYGGSEAYGAVLNLSAASNLIALLATQASATSLKRHLSLSQLLSLPTLTASLAQKLHFATAVVTPVPVAAPGMPMPSQGCPGGWV